MSKTLSLHDQDFFAWTQQQAQFIKDKALDKLDLTYLFEEIESMGNQNKTELKNRLTVLLMHLLKWKYQPEFKGNSWFLTIANQRIDIKDLILDNPSLKHYLPDLFNAAYSRSILKASLETGINKHVFPEQPDWTIEQVLDDEFFPN